MSNARPEHCKNVDVAILASKFGVQQQKRKYCVNKVSDHNGVGTGSYRQLHESFHGRANDSIVQSDKVKDKDHFSKNNYYLTKKNPETQKNKPTPNKTTMKKLEDSSKNTLEITRKMFLNFGNETGNGNNIKCFPEELIFPKVAETREKFLSNRRKEWIKKLGNDKHQETQKNVGINKNNQSIKYGKKTEGEVHPKNTKLLPKSLQNSLKRETYYDVTKDTQIEVKNPGSEEFEVLISRNVTSQIEVPAYKNVEAVSNSKNKKIEATISKNVGKSLISVPEQRNEDSQTEVLHSNKKELQIPHCSHEEPQLPPCNDKEIPHCENKETQSLHNNNKESQILLCTNDEPHLPHCNDKESQILYCEDKETQNLHYNNTESQVLHCNHEETQISPSKTKESQVEYCKDKESQILLCKSEDSQTLYCKNEESQIAVPNCNDNKEDINANDKQIEAINCEDRHTNNEQTLDLASKRIVKLSEEQKTYEGFSTGYERQESWEDIRPLEYDELVHMLGLRNAVELRKKGINDASKNRKSLTHISIEESRRRTQTLLRSYEKDFVIAELIETEKIYIDNLEYLIEHYLKFMRHQLKYNTILIILEKIKEIFEASQSFLEDLQNLPIESKGFDVVGHAFIKNKNLFTKYPVYYKYQKYISELLEDKEIRNLIKSHQELLGDKLGLISYINTPVQRLTKFRLFLEKLIKCMKDDGIPCPKTNRALTILKEKLRRGDDLVLLDSIKGERPNINETGMFLKKETFLKLRPPKKMDVILFAFEEILIIASPKKNSNNYDYISSIRVADLRLGSLKNNLKINFQDLGVSYDIYTLKCLNEDTQNEWYTLLLDIIERRKYSNNNAKVIKSNSVGTSVKSLRSSFRKKSSKVKKSSKMKNLRYANLSQEIFCEIEDNAKNECSSVFYL